MRPTYDAFFQTATDGQTPYAYQCRLACPEPAEWARGEPSRTACGEPSRTACGEPSRTARGEPPCSQISNAESEMHGVPCASQLIHIPTGLGKTAAVLSSIPLKSTERP